MRARLSWTVGRRRHRLLMLLPALAPIIIVFAVLSMVGLTLSGAGAPPNEQADQEQSAAAAAQQAANCGNGAAAAAAPVSSAAPASGPVGAIQFTPDPAVVNAQGITLTGGQIAVARTVVADGAKAKVTSR